MHKKMFFLFSVVLLTLLTSVEFKKPKLLSHPPYAARFWGPHPSFRYGFPSVGVFPGQLQVNHCPPGTTYVGQCVAGLCGYGTVCTSGSCCSFSIVSLPNSNCPTAAPCPTPEPTECPLPTPCPDCKISLLCPVTSCPDPPCPAGTFNDGSCSDTKQCEKRGSFCVGNSCCKICPSGAVPKGECQDMSNCAGTAESPIQCINNLCCPECLVGKPSGLCFGGLGCSGGLYECIDNAVVGALCCPKCLVGDVNGECVSGQCDVGYKCQGDPTNLCCPVCPNGAFPLKMCAESCTETGYACPADKDDLCCPVCPSDGKPDGTCLTDDDCNEGYTCDNDNKHCCPTVGA